MPECSSKKVNNMFLIGAGFTKAVFPKAPLNNDLLEKLIKYRKNKDIPTPLKKYKQEYKTDDIEIILTKLDLEIAGSHPNTTKNLTDDRITIERQIAPYFWRFSFNEEIFSKNKWLSDFAKLFSNNDAIVSLNYDCFLEGLLDYSELWDPTGYVKIANPLFKPEPPNPKNILVYKIHGSSNFRISSAILREKGQKVIGLIINDNFFPRSGKYTGFGDSNETPLYIIAPSFVKIPHVQIADMINKAIKVAPYAKNMVIGGCSLRPEDNSVWLIITSFIKKDLPTTKNLIIIDPYANNIKNRVESYWVGSTQHLNIYPIPKTFQNGIEELLEKLNNCERKK